MGRIALRIPPTACADSWLALLGMSVLQVLHLLWFKELIVKGLRQLRGTGKATEIPDMCAPGGGVHEKHE